jgi:hypothetical protein
MRGKGLFADRSRKTATARGVPGVVVDSDAAIVHITSTTEAGLPQAVFVQL